jgi:NTE family protein
MTKSALIISGGGAKGAFAVGVLKFLHRHTTVDFQLISGTSTGALISPLAATGQFDLLEEIYTSITTRDVFTKGNVVHQVRKENHLFSTEPLLRQVRKYVTAETFDRIVASQIDYFNCCVSLQTGKVIHYSIRDVNIFQNHPYYEIRKIKNPEDLRWSIMASANQPVFTPPIIVDPNESKELCVDGGVKETIPISVALECGATELWVIDNNTLLPDPMDSGAEFGKFLDVLKRTIHLFQKDVSYYDIEVPRLRISGARMIDVLRERLQSAGATATVMSVFEDVAGDTRLNPFAGMATRQMHVLRPEFKLAEDGGLEFIPEQMKQMLSHGFDQARKYFEENQLTHLYKNHIPPLA